MYCFILHHPETNSVCEDFLNNHHLWLMANMSKSLSILGKRVVTCSIPAFLNDTNQGSTTRLRQEATFLVLVGSIGLTLSLYPFVPAAIDQWLPPPVANDIFQGGRGGRNRKTTQHWCRGKLCSFSRYGLTMFFSSLEHLCKGYQT